VGTSVGAFGAAFLVSRDLEDICASINLLESVWLEQVAENARSCGNGVYRIRADPSNYYDPDCLAANPLTPFDHATQDASFFARDVFRKTINFFMSGGTLTDRILELVDVSAFISTNPLKKLVDAAIDLGAIGRSRKILRVVATNWDQGTVRVFENKDITVESGFDILRGSAAIPGIFHPVRIGSDRYVDGGVLMNTPLKCAIQAGGTTLHVIYLDPDPKNISIRALESTINTLDRVMLISSATKVDQDIENAASINLGLSLIERLTGVGDDTVSDYDLRDFIRVAGKIHERLVAGAPYKKLTIHRYHPHNDLGGGSLGLLNFNRDQVESLIERGFADTVNHNCTVSHCILPE
jgi:predicted acylesterase/phospholipase RssA